jgi:uncharacterized protein YqgC (DUF456 family)
MTVFLWTAAVTLVIVGIMGVVLPIVPGTVLVFAGLVLGAWADGFSRVGAGTLVVLGILAAASYGVDVVTVMLGVGRLTASRRAMVGAALGTLCGLAFGLLGVVIGPFAGAVLGQLTTDRNLARAGRAGVAAWLGFAIGTVVKVGLVFVMLGIFVAAFII